MTATLAPEARRNVALFSSDFTAGFVPQFAKKTDDKGKNVLAVSDMPIFRSGTFRDSMGFQHTWEDLHMAQMVSNFELLKSRRIFSDPPVRKGHPSFLSNSMDDLIGYVTSLRTEKRTNPADNKEYTYLLANYDVLDETAQPKIENGLWKNRSSEVGFYLTNDDAEFWPVVMGFAFVDIPAVEGLNFSKMPGVGSTHSVMFEKEALVTTSTVDTTNKGGDVVNPTSSAATSNNANSNTAISPATQPAQPASALATQTAPHSFQIAGQPVTDYAAVQTYIDSLEQFRSDTMTSARKNFVAGLAKDNKILASQVPGLEKFALSLSDDTYKEWIETFAAAPSAPLLGNQVDGTSNHNGNGSESAQDKKNEIDKGILNQHKLAGMPQSDIESTPAYGRLKVQNLV